MHAQLFRIGRTTRHRVAALTVTTVVWSALLSGSTPAAIAGSPGSAGRPHAPGGADARLHQLLEDVAAAGVPGVIARVQDGREVRQGSAGVADVADHAPLRPAARFRVGSITKTFVATVVLQLVGEGRLALDQPVERWLPGLLADGSTITVRQLLNHTSGLFDYTADASLLGGIAQNRVFEPAELVALSESHPRSFPPGTAWGYSNTNYIVAGLLIERVTDHPLAAELRERISAPLGLRQTSLPSGTARMPGYHAHGYVQGRDGTPYDVTAINPSHAWAAGALISSTANLARFSESLMEGKLLPPRLLREMKTTVPEDPADPALRYGLGIERIQDHCGAIWGHSGAIFGYQDMAFWNSRTGASIVVASTISPAPAMARRPLDRLAGFALCAAPGPRPRLSTPGRAACSARPARRPCRPRPASGS